MLRLVKITKDYKLADTVVRALKGVSLSFRANEFVSVLGPSGCGKTTLLNLIGGLDKYTSGDMYIAGRSTREFKDSDWDVYRNHRVGFIFQSYNLIPHQTVLGNVELALTIAGIAKPEREARAKAALDKVGLSDQYNKKPNQLSGGQCQRVAIARALVNDPEVLLADEPTGALDTKTSVQIMDLIKEIAQERLVIMVTHNPELAEQYSTRIIKLLDGELLDDTNPFTAEDEIQECQTVKEKAEAQAAADSELTKSPTSEPTDNVGSQSTLHTDKANSEPSKRNEPNETVGSPNNIHKPKANSEPSKRKEKAKMSFFTAFRLSLQNLFTKKARTIMTSIAGSIGIIGVSLVLSISYGVQSFINNMQNDMLSGNPITISKTAFDINSIMSMSAQSDVKEEIEYIDGHVNVDSIIKQLVESSDAMDKIMVDNTITQDYVDYVKALPKSDAAAVHLDYGLDLKNSIYTDFTDENGNTKSVSISGIRAMYTSILKQTDFADNASLISMLGDPFNQAINDESYVLTQYDFVTDSSRFPKNKNEIMLVLGKSGQLTDLTLGELGYFTQDQFLNSVYKATEDITAPDTNYKKELDVTNISYTDLMKKSFTWYPNDALFGDSMTINYGESSITTVEYEELESKLADKSGAVKLEIVGILQQKQDVSYGCLSSGFYYTEALADHVIAQNANSKLFELLGEDEQSISSIIMGPMVNGIYFDYDYTFGGDKKGKALVGNTNMMSEMLSYLPGMGGALPYDEMRTLSLQQLGGVNIPEKISVYPVSFETKDAVLDYLDKWNEEGTLVINKGQADEKTLTHDQRMENGKVTYSDPISLIISMISTFINVITIALIGFTSLSLVVSCVMIAIITYVSVVERVKEIGIIRSLGGRKKDVSYLFNAETFIIGLVSGIIGIVFTYFASFIINLIVSHFAGIAAIAIFPASYALIMVAVSVLLTLVSGLLPSRSAAKKDPVVALRSE